MDNFMQKRNYFLKLVAVFSLLIGALLFASPVKAEGRELNPTIPAATQHEQVAWFFYWGHHRHWRPYFYRPCAYGSCYRYRPYYYNPYRYYY